MKKFNLFTEIIVVAKNDFARAINSAKKFAISYEGKILYEPFSPTLISIFEGSIAPLSPLAKDLSRPMSTMLGSNYKIVEDGDRILIKASGAWQEIIGYNQKRSLYNDTTADGIDTFLDKDLEAIGWHATEFSIGYREIVEQFEGQCEGILLCIEQESPYQFSGLGFLFDLDHARKIAFEYCVTTINDKLKNDADFATLTKDEAEAAEYFKAL
jgi:hypothetical protein